MLEVCNQDFKILPFSTLLEGENDTLILKIWKTSAKSLSDPSELNY